MGQGECNAKSTFDSRKEQHWYEDTQASSTDSQMLGMAC